MIDTDLLKYLTGFFVVAIAAYEIAKFLQKKLNFPLITGLILTGILAGSSFLGFIPEYVLPKLNFLNEIALAIIAFSAGVELHLEELRSRMKSIQWMTFGQVVITFAISSTIIYHVESFIPFLQGMPSYDRLIISMLFATIFVARSPSSAIAIIDELRARGPFVKTVMGVTVVTDVLVIILFAIIFSLAKNIIHEEALDIMFFVLLILQILLSVGLGFFFGKILKWTLQTNLNFNIKSLTIILIGYSIYSFNHLVKMEMSKMGIHFELEPLLMAITASFYITNYTSFNHEFEKIINFISPYIYIIFFTLTGESLSLKVLISVLGIAVLLFLVRLLGLILGGFFGIYFAGEPKKYYGIAWMPYITQAGVAIGLTTIISQEFPEWGHQFETLIIAIIVINQIIGPPFFKWAIKFVGEEHQKHIFEKDNNQKSAVIFSLDSVSLALAKLLKDKGWKVKIVTTQKVPENSEIEILHVDKYNKDNISRLKFGKPDSVILLYPDDEKNFEIAEWIYESIGSPNIVTRLHSGSNAQKFKEIGVKIIEPTAAMINLLDHMVRAPEATHILLGMADDQDTIDVEVHNPDMMGLRIRDLHLPQDVIILSLKRRGNIVITHGYTQLRVGDILTFVGSKESLDKVKIRFEY